MLSIENKKLAHSKIEEIIGIVNNSIIDNYDIFTGKAGFSLLYYYYYKMTKNKEYLFTTIDSLEKSYELLNKVKEPYDYSYGYGITGLAWTFEFFVKEKLINKDDIKIFDTLDQYINNALLFKIKSGNYEFINGAIGIGLYLLNHLSNSYSKGFIINFIDIIETVGINENGRTWKWSSIRLNDEKQSKIEFDLGISKGLAGIVVFLSKVYSKGIYKEKVKYLLEGLIEYILLQKFDPEINNSCFPDRVFEEKDKKGGRLTWCNGDLGIAIALLQAAKSLKNKEWEKIAIDVFVFSTTRKNLKNEVIYDAGIYRGTCGAAQVYNRLFWDTGIELFKESSDFWVEETLKMSKHENGLAGYKAWRSQSHGYINSYGVLDGIAGIGLTLISSINNFNPKWDECLLLS